MDSWVIVAATGAGYVAKHLKDIMKGGLSISNPSSGIPSCSKPELPSTMQELEDKNCHLHKLCRRKKLGKEFYEERDSVYQVASTADVSSTNGIDSGKLELVKDYVDCDVLSQTCLSPRLLSNCKPGDFNESSSDLFLKPSTKEMGSLYNRRILRSKRNNRQVIKPINSLESCLMAQIYKEQDDLDMEAYMRSARPSTATPTVRPLLVTDGSRIISRASSHLKNVHVQTGGKKAEEVSSQERGTAIGIPPLPKAGRSNEVKMRKDRGGRLSSSSKVIGAKYSNLQGSSHGAILFYIGISVGIMSSLLSNRQEVEKLNDLLKQTEDLVRDLQDELDMKDSVTVKEIIVDTHESQDTHEDTFGKEVVVAFSSEQKFDQLTANGLDEDCDKRRQEESMRKIEAELEAELTKLELNMTSSTLDAQFSDLLELDEDSVPDITRGELRADMFARQAGEKSHPNRDESGSSTPHTINYAVSPRELTLRLHELLESRLEERVEELEMALQNSVKKVQRMESECTKSWRQFSNSETGSSSTQGSPHAKEENVADEAAVIHLADDALHAYNEAYDEFTMVKGSKEEGLGSEARNNQESLHNFDQDIDWIENSSANHYIPHHSDARTNALLTIVHRGEDDHRTLSKEIHNNDERDNYYENDDEMEQMLIKQILEKARQGSPAVLKARKILFSMDDN